MWIKQTFNRNTNDLCFEQKGESLRFSLRRPFLVYAVLSRTILFRNSPWRSACAIGLREGISFALTMNFILYLLYVVDDFYLQAAVLLGKA